jgi:ATP-dependent Zn protease
VSTRDALERARTAYHEAGHLVIGIIFGFRCSSVSIRPDEARGSLGRTAPIEGHTGEPQSRETVERWLCVLFAGYAAEVRFAPDAREAAREGARGDDEQAEQFLKRAAMANNSVRSLLRARTAALVEQHWAAIQSVARALLKHEEFDSDDAERITEIARGEATEADLERYRALRAHSRARPPRGLIERPDDSVTLDCSDERERALYGVAEDGEGSA